MIRHGQALHNYRDLLKDKKIDDDYNLGQYTSKSYDVYLNSCLTPKGVEQAQGLYTDLKKYFSSDNFLGPNDILISSPMDRTIQTLVEGVTPPDKFLDLKEKFKIMYNSRFPDAVLLVSEAVPSVPPSPAPVAVPLVEESKEPLVEEPNLFDDNGSNLSEEKLRLYGPTPWSAPEITDKSLLEIANQTAPAAGGNLDVGSRFQRQFTTKHRRFLNLRRSRKSKSKKPISQSKSSQKVSKRKVTYQRKKKSGKKSSQKK